MTRVRAIFPVIVLATAVAALPLAGCISVFPKQAPAQLYRFDAAAVGSPDAPGSGDGARVEVVAAPVTVSRASAGDQILALTGDQAAFIAGARWVSPAAVLWDETVRRAFSARSARVRLLSRSEIAGGRAFLRIDVPQFEVRYPSAGATPSAAVTLHALYTHRNGVFSAERTFTASAPAAADTVSSIVAAFDQAVEKATAELLGWADAHAGEAGEAGSTTTTRLDTVPVPAAAVRSTSPTTTSSSTRRTPAPPRP